MSDNTAEVKSAPEPKKQSAVEMESEIKRLELEAKRLEVAERKANLQDVEERLADRELKRESKRQNSLTNGATLKQLAANDAAVQKRCNHHKGGDGADGIIAGKGTSSQYAVIKHTFCNGDTWVRCLRCGKTWKPPIKAQYDGAEAYTAALVQFNTALEFQTQNKPSGSVMFQFSDGGKMYRDKTASTNLR